jgi:ribosomal protein L40E
MTDDPRQAQPGPAADQPADEPHPPSEAEAWVAPPPPSEPTLPAHSVPATPLGETVRCPRCAAENRPGIAFCRSCGQRLAALGTPATAERPGERDGTSVCPRCGTHNRAGAAFCQSCGANLRPGAPVTTSAHAPAPAPAAAGGRAVLGPAVLLVAAVGLLIGWVLPFEFGATSLWDRSFGAPGGYGIAFWSGYAAISGGLLDKAYFGLAAPVPLLIAGLLTLAAIGPWRAAPGRAQRIGLLLALAWGAGLSLLFLVVELIGGPGGGMIETLRALSPAGVIFFLAGLVAVIGSLTRLARG